MDAATVTLAVFLAIIALSLALALWSRRRVGARDARAFFVASGQLGGLFVFFLAVGETYSVASMLGYPGGIYAHGDAFSAWFFGYILLVAPVLFFVGPWIRRAGGLHGAATIADFFGRQFESRAVEIIVALAAIAALVPVGTMQFLGLKIVLGALAPAAPSLLLTGSAATLAFAYVAIAGLRGSAYVAILKDVLMIGAILLVSGVALVHWHQGLSPPPAAATPMMTARDGAFAITTILVQAAGYAMLPQTWGFLFAARSSQAIRSAQIGAPIYMVMFPLLACVATYALYHGLHPAKPDQVFLVTAGALLPGWTMGLVLAGVTLAGLVLLAAVCLAIGSLVTRNLLAGLSSDAQQRGAKLVTAIYLLLSVASAAGTSQLMVTMNNLVYFGIVQLLPGFVAAMLLPRVPAAAVIVGIIAGDVAAMMLFAGAIDVGGVNPGLIGLAFNAALLAAITRLRPVRDRQAAITLLRAAADDQ